MRIVLVRPPFVDERFGPPIGLAYLSKALKEEGNEVVIYDINLEIKKFFSTPMDNYNRDFVLPRDHPSIKYANDNIEKYCDTILSFQPDTVGIHLSYPTVAFGNELAKRLSPYVRCIAGGPQTTYHQQHLLDAGCYEAIVVGYGEEAVLEAIKRNGIIQKPLIRSKEYLPDYTDIPIDKYNGRLPVIVTRGCPNRCTFCTQHLPCFFHSIESVVDQIRNTPNIRNVMYNDSNINVSTNRTERLFIKIAELKNPPRGLIFGLEIKKDFKRYISKMAEAGIKKVRIGIESGSIRERKSMNKPFFDNETVIELVKELTVHKISTVAQFIFCYPDQTEIDRQETVKLINRMNDSCDADYIKHLWYKFVVHNGVEKLFKEKYGVIASSPQDWKNPLYSTGKIEKIAEKYCQYIPANAEILR